MKVNDEVEIIEEPRDIEVCGSLFTKSEYDELAKSKDKQMKNLKLVIDNKDLQQRIDKAIKYIKENSNYNITLVQNALIGKDIDELLNILEGEDNGKTTN